MIPSPSRLSLPLALAVAATVAVGGAFAAAALLSGDPAPPRRPGPALAVAVVPPVERDFDPGSTMEVGDLNDGFDRAALERTAALEGEAPLPLDAYAGPDAGAGQAPLMPPPTPVQAESAPMQAYRAVVSRDHIRDFLNDGSRMFGFDRPRPDFAAERAARWARREAQAARAAPADPPAESGPVPYEDVIRYSPE